MTFPSKPQSLWRLALVCGCLFIFSTTQAADDSFAANVSRAERLQLEKIVCGDPFGLAVAQIDARAMEANGRAYFADVKCRPHLQMLGQAVYHVAQCGRDGNQWSCGEPELETIVPLAQRRLLVRPGSVDLQRGVATIKKISGYGYFQGLSIDRALQSTCNLGLGNRSDLIEISCQRWSITVSFWCPQSKQDPTCPRIIYMAEH